MNRSKKKRHSDHQQEVLERGVEKVSLRSRVCIIASMHEGISISVKVPINEMKYTQLYKCAPVPFPKMGLPYLHFSPHYIDARKSGREQQRV